MSARDPAGTQDAALRFVFAAARHRLTVTHAAQLCDAAAEVSDWAAAVAAAESHRVVPFVARNITAHAQTVVPGHAQQAFAGAAAAVAARALQATAELARLMRAFGDAGLPVLPYKGPALAVAAYGDPGSRASADLDLVVHSRDYAAARRVLLEAGYRSSHGLSDAQERTLYSAFGHAPFVRERAPAAPFVELHWRFAGPRFRWNPVLDAILTRAEPLVLGGVQMPGCAADDHLLLALLHGTRHLWCDLEWVVAVDALLARPGVNVGTILARATDVGGRRAALVGLAVAHEVLGTPLPDAVAAMMQGDRRVAGLAATATRMLNGSAGPAAGSNAFARAFHLACLDSARDRARYVLAAALLPSPRELEVVRLPSALTPLYYPIRLARLLTRTRAT